MSKNMRSKQYIKEYLRSFEQEFKKNKIPLGRNKTSERNSLLHIELYFFLKNKNTPLKIKFNLSNF